MKTSEVDELKQSIDRVEAAVNAYQPVISQEELKRKMQEAIARVTGKADTQQSKARTPVSTWEFRPPGTNVQLLVCKADDDTMWMWHVNQWFQMKSPELEGLPDKE